MPIKNLVSLFREVIVGWCKCCTMNEFLFLYWTGLSCRVSWSDGERWKGGQQSFILQRDWDRGHRQLPRQAHSNTGQEGPAKTQHQRHWHYHSLQETGKTENGYFRSYWFNIRLNTFYSYFMQNNTNKWEIYTPLYSLTKYFFIHFRWKKFGKLWTLWPSWTSGKTSRLACDFDLFIWIIYESFMSHLCCRLFGSCRWGQWKSFRGRREKSS